MKIHKNNSIFVLCSWTIKKTKENCSADWTKVTCKNCLKQSDDRTDNSPLVGGK